MTRITTIPEGVASRSNPNVQPRGERAKIKPGVNVQHPKAVITWVVPNLGMEPESVPAPLAESRIRTLVAIPSTSLIVVEEIETETVLYRGRPEEPESVSAPLAEPRIRRLVPTPFTSLAVEETETVLYRGRPEEFDQRGR
jgi:hypothetical protein